MLRSKLRGNPCLLAQAGDVCSCAAPRGRKRPRLRRSAGPSWGGRSGPLRGPRHGPATGDGGERGRILGLSPSSPSRSHHGARARAERRDRGPCRGRGQEFLRAVSENLRARRNQEYPVRTGGVSLSRLTETKGRIGLKRLRAVLEPGKRSNPGRYDIESPGLLESVARSG